METQWSHKIDAILSIVLVIAAIAVSASYVYKTFVPSAQSRDAVPAAATRMEGWADALAVGHTLSGGNDARTTLVMFGDLECPACGSYNATLQKAITDHPRDLRVLYISFPLAYHRFALPAARATECVSKRGNLGKWIDVVYREQDSLGIKSWDTYANDASIADTTGIDACAQNPSTVQNIEASIALGKRTRIKGTPTIVINGWIYPDPPSSAQIDSAVARNNQGL